MVVTVFGTRPQFIKLSVLWRPLQEQFRSVLIDSGQHYDHALAGSFHEETGLRLPDDHLGIRSASAAAQIGRIADALDARLARLKPQAVIVFGDTSTTAGAAIAAAYRNIPIAHIEAGLRCGNRDLPEEKNRILADHLAHWCFAPTETAITNLHSEGIKRGVIGVGDLMYENWRHLRRSIKTDDVSNSFGVRPGEFFFVTCHRAGTVDHRSGLAAWISILESLDQPTIWPVHPRTMKNLRRHRLLGRLKRLRHLTLTPPLPHGTTLALASAARAVLTDSGGLQREAFWFGTPCLVLRDTTEWTELVRCGGIDLVALDTDKIARSLRSRRRSRTITDRIFAARFPSRRIVRRLVRDLIDH